MNGTVASQNRSRLLSQRSGQSVSSIRCMKWWWLTQKIATVKQLTAKLTSFGARAQSSLHSCPDDGSGILRTSSSNTSTVTMIAMTLSLNASTRVVPEIRGRLRMTAHRRTARSSDALATPRYPERVMVQREAVLVRAAIRRDARPVAEVHVASWRHAYRGLLPDDYLDKLSIDVREAMWREAFANPDPKSGAIVAEMSGRIVGFASFGPSRDEDVSDGTGEVPAIYVEPATLGTGVGRELFEAVTLALRGAGFVRATLWVLEANATARRFYEKAGWRWDGAVSTHMFDCANEPVVRYAVDL